MTSLANNNISTRAYRVSTCSLCGLTGHNMATCIRLRFYKNQAHRLYLHMWQKWIEEMMRGSLNNYLDYANLLLQENSKWLKNMNNFRLLKSLLNLNRQGTDKDIRTYIEGLYHYLVMTKYGLYDQNTGTLDRYRFYDYLLDTIPYNNTFSNVRQYGITVQKINIQEANLLKSCPICYDDVPFNNLVKTNCCHTFCENCITNTIKILPINNNLSCAMCRTNINHLFCYNSNVNTNLKKILNI